MRVPHSLVHGDARRGTPGGGLGTWGQTGQWGPLGTHYNPVTHMRETSGKEEDRELNYWLDTFDALILYMRPR